MGMGTHGSCDYNGFAVQLSAAYYRRVVCGPKTALNLHRRCGLVNQEVDSGRECLLEIQQIAHDCDQNAILIEFRPPDRAKELGEIVDVSPIHDDSLAFTV